MTKKKTAGAEGKPTFEKAMERLEEIVKNLEGEDLPLEESLRIFEEGVALSRQLNARLDEAEGKVEILLADGKGKTEARPFGPLDGEDDHLAERAERAEKAEKVEEGDQDTLF